MDRKRFVTEASIESAIAPSDLIERIRDPASWPEWQSEIVSTDGPERVSEGDVVPGHAAMLGFEVDGQSFTVEASDRHYVEDVVVGVGMRVSYAVEETPSGTRLTHRLECELPGGPMGSVLSFFLKRRFVKMERELLRKLASGQKGSRRAASSE